MSAQVVTHKGAIVDDVTSGDGVLGLPFLSNLGLLLSDNEAVGGARDSLGINNVPLDISSKD
jgi:hypothetical protein